MFIFTQPDPAADIHVIDATSGTVVGWLSMDGTYRRKLTRAQTDLMITEALKKKPYAKAA